MVTENIFAVYATLISDMWYAEEGDHAGETIL